MLQKIQAIYFKIQGTYFKISALYFSPSQISDKQQLTKPRQKTLFCWFSESCKNSQGFLFFAYGAVGAKSRTPDCG